MSIKSGRYIITHAQHFNLASLSDANNGTSLLGCLEQDVPGEEWNIKELQNGRYSIVNFGHKTSASAVFQAQRGEDVVGRARGSVWLIKEHGSEGKYTIATANDKLRWCLEDSWPETPITLHDAPPSDQRCLWNFQKIGRINAMEVAGLKAELAVAKRDAAHAKEEVGKYKPGFKSYVKLASQLYTAQITIPNVLDEDNLPSIQAALFWAARNGDDAEVPLLLEQEGVDVNYKGKYGESALLLAAQNGRNAVVRLLLAHEGVDVNAMSKNGWTPLMLAEVKKHETIVRLLREKILQMRSRA